MKKIKDLSKDEAIKSIEGISFRNSPLLIVV